MIPMICQALESIRHFIGACTPSALRQASGRRGPLPKYPWPLGDCDLGACLNARISAKLGFMESTEKEFALHFESQGTGPPLLLIHGFPLNSRMWAGQIAPLSNHAQALAPGM